MIEINNFKYDIVKNYRDAFDKDDKDIYNKVEFYVNITNAYLPIALLLWNILITNNIINDTKILTTEMFELAYKNINNITNTDNMDINELEIIHQCIELLYKFINLKNIELQEA